MLLDGLVLASASACSSTCLCICAYGLGSARYTHHKELPAMLSAWVTVLDNEDYDEGRYFCSH